MTTGMEVVSSLALLAAETPIVRAPARAVDPVTGLAQSTLRYRRRPPPHAASAFIVKRPADKKTGFRDCGFRDVADPRLEPRRQVDSGRAGQKVEVTVFMRGANNCGEALCLGFIRNQRGLRRLRRRGCNAVRRGRDIDQEDCADPMRDRCRGRRDQRSQKCQPGNTHPDQFRAFKKLVRARLSCRGD
jgi:hypothetical protein